MRSKAVIKVWVIRGQSSGKIYGSQHVNQWINLSSFISTWYFHYNNYTIIYIVVIIILKGQINSNSYYLVGNK